MTTKSKSGLSSTSLQSLRRTWVVVLALLVSLGAPGPVRAQSTPGEDAAVDWVRPEEIAVRADALLRQLEAAQPDAAAEPSLAKIEKSLPQLGRDLDVFLRRATEAIENATDPGDLEDISREFAGAAAPLTEWKDELAAQGKRVAEGMDMIEGAVRVWSETRRHPETLAAGDVVMRRVTGALEALGDAGASLRAWRTRVLDTSDRIIERQAAVDAAFEKLQAASAGDQASLFIPNRAPIWSRGLGAQIRNELPRVRQEMLAYADSTAAYIERDARPLVVQALLAACLMFALARFSFRALGRLGQEEAAVRATRLLERPYAIGLLLTLLASPAFHPFAPRRFMQLLATFALFPAARIVTHASERANLAAFAGLFVLLLLDRLGAALQPLPALERAIFMITMATGLGLAFWFSRRVQVDEVSPWFGRAANLAMFGFALALLAEIGGWTFLAALIGRGIVASVIAALYVYAAAIALAALVAYALASRTARRSRLLGRNAAFLQARAEGLLRGLAVGVWLYFLATALGLRGAAANVLTTLLSSGITVGALSLSVGGVLAFALTVPGAILLARVVTAILEEDVYPRTQLPRGVPYALSTLVRYGVYSLGFLFALAAAGVRLDQVTIMVGGVGIGIGLGLQDLVKNFAAGLTLLFERRVHVGDTLEMPSHGIFGRVISIGIRASVVRGWNGAEVVVPNADLISSAVTNWTLSDRLCRLEVPVGVAYGTEPERVIELLLEAAGSNEQLLKEPAPQAFFKGFGESSLDFIVRAWIDQGYERALPLTSELALAVHGRLRDAGVTVPFPQHDLHLASVSPAARKALTGGDGRD